MKRQFIGTTLGGLVMFATMAFAYPAVRGQPLWDVPWIVISAVAAAVAAPLASFLTRHRKRAKTKR